MNVIKATRQYEKWLCRHTRLVQRDLRLKHLRMKESPLCFLRATFYRWMQMWPQICSDLNKAPKLLAVGDLHVENFGTWRDAEGRLIWGVNDFDEAAVLPYTLDLVRLATSAFLATAEGHIGIKAKDICGAILEGYRQSIETGGLPFVLAEDNIWLRDIAFVESRDPVHFWRAMDALPTARTEIPAAAQDALERLMPASGLAYRVFTRTAGLGSLGHMRFVAIAEFNGARIAREAKAIVPSAVYWAGKSKGSMEIKYRIILRQAVRAPDPFVQLRGHWLVRRLAPYCSRIELTSVPKQRDEWRMLSAMGGETANIHLGTGKLRKELLSHLKQLKSGWLLTAAKEMSHVVSADWQAWSQSALK